MGGLAPGQLKSRRGWHSSPRRLHYRFSFFDRVSRTHCGKNSINFAGMAHSHRHRLAAAWPSLVRQIGPVLRRRRQPKASSLFWMERIKSYGSFAVSLWIWWANSAVADTGPVNSKAPTTSRPIPKATFTLRRLTKGSAFRSSSTSYTDLHFGQAIL